MTSDSSAQPGQLGGPLSLPDGSVLVMRVMPLPADVNGNGDVFGGWIMAQVDIAGAGGRPGGRRGPRPAGSG